MSYLRTHRSTNRRVPASPAAVQRSGRAQNLPARQHHRIIPYTFTSDRTRNPSISLPFMLPSACQRT